MLASAARDQRLRTRLRHRAGASRPAWLRTLRQSRRRLIDDRVRLTAARMRPNRNHGGAHCVRGGSQRHRDRGSVPRTHRPVPSARASARASAACALLAGTVERCPCPFNNHRVKRIDDGNTPVDARAMRENPNLGRWKALEPSTHGLRAGRITRS